MTLSMCILYPCAQFLSSVIFTYTHTLHAHAHVYPHTHTHAHAHTQPLYGHSTSQPPGFQSIHESGLFSLHDPDVKMTDTALSSPPEPHTLPNPPSIQGTKINTTICIIILTIDMLLQLRGWLLRVLLWGRRAVVSDSATLPQTVFCAGEMRVHRAYLTVLLPLLNVQELLK